jgi:hypothetical protein
MANSVVIGPTPAVIQANLHVEQGNLFIGNSAATGTTVNTVSVTQGTLVFDNTANNSIIPNKIILYNNVGSVFCGLGVNFVGATSATLAYYSQSVHQFITGTSTEKMRIGTTGVSISTLANARSNLDVAGNIFASNALSTTNVFASGQVVATGKSGVGVCPPIVYRQGGSATNWNTPGSNTTPNVYAITSGVVQMQCGANVMTSTTQFIPFPVAYTNNPTVLVTSYGTTGNIWVASITSSAFSVSANTAQQFEWLSIGI